MGFKLSDTLLPWVRGWGRGWVEGREGVQEGGREEGREPVLGGVGVVFLTHQGSRERKNGMEAKVSKDGFPRSRSRSRGGWGGGVVWTMQSNCPAPTVPSKIHNIDMNIFLHRFARTGVFV